MSVYIYIYTHFFFQIVPGIREHDGPFILLTSTGLMCVCAHVPACAL